MRPANTRLRAPQREPVHEEYEVRKQDLAPSFNGLRALDWRGWLMVAWVAWFGALYIQMMLAARASTFMAIVRRLLQRLSLGA